MYSRLHERLITRFLPGISVLCLFFFIASLSGIKWIGRANDWLTTPRHVIRAGSISCRRWPGIAPPT